MILIVMGKVIGPVAMDVVVRATIHVIQTRDSVCIMLEDM
jgi:hypothetical protein